MSAMTSVYIRPEIIFERAAITGFKGILEICGRIGTVNVVGVKTGQGRIEIFSLIFKEFCEIFDELPAKLEKRRNAIFC
jgi:hypothetical protein